MFQPNHIPIISNICFTASMLTTGRQHFEPAFSSRSQASRSVVYSITIRVEIIHLSTAKPNHPSRSAAWCCPKLTQSSLEKERKFPTVVEWLNRSRSIPIQGGSRGTSHDKHHVDGCPARSTKRPFWCFPPTKCKQTKLTVLGAGDAGGFCFWMWEHIHCPFTNWTHFNTANSGWHQDGLHPHKIGNNLNQIDYIFHSDFPTSNECNEYRLFFRITSSSLIGLESSSFLVEEVVPAKFPKFTRRTSKWWNAAGVFNGPIH